MKKFEISKTQARAILAALDWCECDFTLGKAQENVRKKLHKLFPDLPNIYKHSKAASSL